MTSSPLLDPEVRLQRSLERIALQYRAALGEDLPRETFVGLAHRTGLWACASGTSGAPILDVGSDTIRLIDELALKLSASPLLGDADGKRPARLHDAGDLREALAGEALDWLLLHELMHLRLSHLSILGRGYLVEVALDDQPRAADPLHAAIKGALSEQEWRRVRPCLELQADNDASDIHFGAFAGADWDETRLKAAGAFMVMMLIERENERIGAGGITHPQASTRLFQLAAQLAQFWLYDDTVVERRDGESRLRSRRKRSDEEFERYMNRLFGPIMLDAMVIAAALGATGFVVKADSASAFLEDISAAQHAPDLAPERFVTAGAREWAALLPVNEKIMAVTGLRRWSELAR